MIVHAGSTVEPAGVQLEGATQVDEAAQAETTATQQLQAPAEPIGPMQQAERESPLAERTHHRPYIVVLGLDLSEPGGRAWRFAFELATLRGEDTEVHAVVTGSRGMAPAVADLWTPRVSSTSGGDRMSLPPLKVLEHRCAGGQARLMAMHYRVGSPERAIVRLARELHADLIVVSSTRPTTRLQRLFGGSAADRIARNAPCPVVVVRPKLSEDDPGVTEYEPRRSG